MKSTLCTLLALLGLFVTARAQIPRAGNVDLAFRPSIANAFGIQKAVAVEVAPNGDYLVFGQVGHRLTLWRIHPEGRLLGTIEPDLPDLEGVSEIARTPGGDGMFVRGHGDNNQRLLRFRLEGSVTADDAVFNANATRFKSGSGLLALPDGGVLLRWVQVALKADGTLKTAFDFQAAAGLNWSPVAIQPDGRLLLRQVTGSGPEGQTRLVRLHPNGDLDESFSAEPFAGAYSITALGLQADGNILVAGSFPERLVRLSPEGTRDATFAMDTARVPSYVSDLSLDARDGILVRGELELGRFHGDGTTDESFTREAEAWLAVRQIAAAGDWKPLANGEILWLSAAGRDLGSSDSLLRIDSAGRLDESFSQGILPLRRLKELSAIPGGRVLAEWSWSGFLGPESGWLLWTQDGQSDPLTSDLPKRLFLGGA